MNIKDIIAIRLIKIGKKYYLQFAADEYQTIKYYRPIKKWFGYKFETVTDDKYNWFDVHFYKGLKTFTKDTFTSRTPFSSVQEAKNALNLAYGESYKHLIVNPEKSEHVDFE